MNKHILEPEKWIERYADILYSFVCNRIKDNEQAKDIVQETFFSAFKAKDTFEAKASEKTWLIAICKNKIIDYFRKQSKLAEHELSQNELVQFNYQGYFNSNHNPKDWAINYSEVIENKEFYNILLACKNKLKDLQNAVFQLKHLDDLDTPEICKLLEISSSNYWVLMHRAKVNLRSCLEKNWINT